MCQGDFGRILIPSIVTNPISRFDFVIYWNLPKIRRVVYWNETLQMLSSFVVCIASLGTVAFKIFLSISDLNEKCSTYNLNYADDHKILHMRW